METADAQPIAPAAAPTVAEPGPSTDDLEKRLAAIESKMDELNDTPPRESPEEAKLRQLWGGFSELEKSLQRAADLYAKVRMPAGRQACNNNNNHHHHHHHL